jgi:hypothetical protein
MDLIADVMLACGALGAGLYCHVLSGRLRRFTALESGMGGAIAVLSAQVDDMTRVLAAAQTSAQGSGAVLEGQVARAEAVAQRLELLMASLHDLPAGDAPDAPVGDPPDRTLRFVRRRRLPEVAA